jgi:hypothetical protein
VNLNHFRLLRVVGKGAFGKVRIVEKKNTGLTFALKYIRKDEGLWSYIVFPQSKLTSGCSYSIREREEYNTGAADVRAFEPPLHLQLAV